MSYEIDQKQVKREFTEEQVTEEALLKLKKELEEILNNSLSYKHGGIFRKSRFLTDDEIKVKLNLIEKILEN